jgi:hypothetical protein
LGAFPKSFTDAAQEVPDHIRLRVHTGKSEFGSRQSGASHAPFYNGHMPSFRRSLIASALLIGLSGCGSYDPPVRGDHTSDHYKSDLEACRTSSSHSVYLRNARSPGTWIISPITGPPAVRAAIRTCMQGKGYVLENAGG